ncbi:unnamed protein product [marine sediment metagenome]|uniref:Uncharacterized protein n=1 Tax=marine sediment metagenome TaxID=412755 RepID=X1BCJ1_9ZZZZ
MMKRGYVRRNICLPPDDDDWCLEKRAKEKFSLSKYVQSKIREDRDKEIFEKGKMENQK